MGDLIDNYHSSEGRDYSMRIAGRSMLVGIGCLILFLGITHADESRVAEAVKTTVDLLISPVSSKQEAGDHSLRKGERK